jgi:hypothetical protein
MKKGGSEGGGRFDRLRHRRDLLPAGGLHPGDIEIIELIK